MFSTPWLAFLVAAGATSVPIVIHLLNRKRFRVVTWAAMRFLLAAQRKNARRLRLEQLVLLAVRTLVVLLVVLAMASVMPWAEDFWHRVFPDSMAFASPGGRRTHKVLVLDGSFSMGLKVNDVTVFDRARQLAGQVIRESPGGDGFSVVLMAAPPRRIVSEPSEDARKVAAEVESLRLPHGNADLPATLLAVEDLLRQSPGKFDSREVYFFTDLQQSTWLTRHANLAATVQRLRARARTFVLDAGEGGVANLAVTNLALGLPMATTGTHVPLVATVHNYGPETRETRVELLVGRAKAASPDPPLNLRVEAQTTVKTGRGPNAVGFQYRFPAPGDYVVQVRLGGDALDLDDVRSAVVSVKDTVPVMLVNGKPAPEPFDRATEWLRLALNPFDEGRTPGDLPARPKVLTESQFADAGLGDLAPYDCVFLCDVPRLSVPEVRRLEAHLRRGGGVVVSLGDNVDLGAYNEFLYRGGNGLLPARLVARQRASADQYFHFTADTLAYEQPPLAAFGDQNDRDALVTARFRQYVRTEPAPRGQARKVLAFAPAAASGPKAADLPAGDAALLEWQPLLPAPGAGDGPRGADSGPRPTVRARGRVVLVTTTVNMDWTSWPASRSYLPLMQELLQFAVAGRLREQALTVGDVLELHLPSAGPGMEASLGLPDGGAESLQAHAHEDGGSFRFTAADLSGVYRLTVGRHPQEHVFAVNVPASADAQQGGESDPARVAREDLEKAYPDWDLQVATDPRDLARAAGASLQDEEGSPRALGAGVARWLLLAVLALVFAEVVLAWRFGHYSAVAGAPGSPAAKGRFLPGLAGTVALAALLLFGVVLGHAAWTGDFLGFAPEGLRRSAEQALGIPPPAPGEGTRWRLEFTPFLWDGATDPWLAGLLAAAAAVLVVWIYRQEGTVASIRYKLLLAGLRVCSVLLLLAVLLPQLRLWFERQGWPDVAVVLDDSHSMSAADRYRDPQVRAAADRLAKTAELPAPERLALAQALLTRGESDWLRRLLLERRVKVHVYHCSGRAARLRSVTGAEDLDGAGQAVRDLKAGPGNDSSRLGSAVRQVLNDFRGSSLSAVVMLTDGVTTEGEDLPKAARYAAQAGVPLFFVGLGDNHEVRDLELHDLQVEDAVYVNDRVVFEARLTAHGYTDKGFEVRLREKGSDQALATETVQADPQGRPVKVRLVHRPTTPGEKTYVVDVRPEQDEAQADNNALERRVLVREARLIKVLYVEGYSRYEYRYVKTLLERESDRAKGNKSIDLKVLLLDAEQPDYALQDRSALADFPTKAELNQYDVVILGDVDPRAEPKMAEHLKNLADFVKERGGGLLVLAGERHNPHAYKNTPLADVLPVEVTADRQPDEPAMGRPVGFRPALTPMGRLHPVFRFSPDEKQSDEVWGQLKELYWWSEGYVARRAAEVLAVHPRHASAEGDRLGLEGHPLVVQHFVGAGRCLFFGINETWRWRWREHEQYFNQFWVQTVRYLARSRLGRVELRLDKQTPYRRGEPMKVTVRFPDDAPPPGADTEVKVLVERRPARGAADAGTEVETLQLAKVEGSRATFEGLLTRTPDGDYRVSLTVPSATPQPRAEARVLAPPGELERLRMNQPDLERAAEETHGRFYTLAEADRLIDDLPAGVRVTLNTPGPPYLVWNHAAVFGLGLFLLGMEWVLRKRKHLL